MPRSLIEQPLCDQARIALLRDALGEEDLRAVLSEFPGAARQALCGIAAALACNDLIEVGRLAHGFKGVASSLGALRLAVIARDLELEAASIAAMNEGMHAFAAAIDDTLAALTDIVSAVEVEP